MNTERALVVEDLRVALPGGEPLVNGATLSVEAGEVVALVGESGSGKSLTALAVAGLLPSDLRCAGTVTIAGHTVRSGAAAWRLRPDDVAVVFQDPTASLTPTMRVGQQISEPARVHRAANARDAHQAALDALVAVGITDPERVARSYPHELSGGMRQRAMIAMALVISPSLLIADEPTTALDVTVQAQVLATLRKVNQTFGTSILFISHDLGVVRSIADRVVVMYHGQIVEELPAVDLFTGAAHPYTEALVGALPSLDMRPGEELDGIPGSPPRPGDEPLGCCFAARCGYAVPRCASEPPAMRLLVPAHRAACHLLDVAA